MAPPANQPAAAGNAGAAREQPSIFRSVFQSLMIFVAVQWGISTFMGGSFLGMGKTNTDASTTAVVGKSGPIPNFEERPTTWAQDVQFSAIPANIAPLWPIGIPLDLDIYVSSSLVLPPLNKLPKESLIVEERGFEFGNWKDKREIHTTFPVPKESRNNGSIWAHFFVGQHGFVLDPQDPKYDPSKAYNFVYPLTQYMKKKVVKKTRNLLTATNETETEEVVDKSAPPVFASYYHPNFTTSFVADMSTHNYPSMHPALRGFVQLERTGARDESGQNGWYYPILYVDTFWQLRKQMTELNNTVTELPFYLHINNIANWRFSMVASINEGIKLNAAKAARGEDMGMGGDGAEFEMFKEILLDSNIYLLCITGIASILHMIFEGLAFKNDVSHWRKKKDNVGTSVRTILANVFMQSVIFLYLMDNNENTSWMILFGQGMGIAIEAWKVTKMVDVRIRPTPAGSLLPYTVVFEDKHKLSETEKKTKEYDEIAFKYLYIVAVPLLLAYAVYSLYYDTHKSWYSFIIATLVGSVYAYGFLMMVPSLYINYRLKSVAHMPGKAMTYKFLNTFIDDLFAFTIKMPTLHRLATLRDDVIFFVYLYQTWKYKVDYNRVNEFGQGGDEATDEGNSATHALAAAPEPGKDAQAKALLTKDIKTLEADVQAKATGVEKSGKGKKRK